MQCSICGETLTEVLRSEVHPDDLYDDATVRIVACPSGTHEASLLLIQSERRGALNDETVDTKEIPLTNESLTRLKRYASSCPKKDEASCTCEWHAIASADALKKYEQAIKRRAGSPFIKERDEESNYFHYGKSS